MKAIELIAKLNKLAEINPDANVYLYADKDTIEFIRSRRSNGNLLSDIGLILSRTYANGDGLISVDMENTDIGKSKENRCVHETVLEIYKDGTREEISHYRCVQCGDKKEIPFGKNIVKSSGEDRRITL